MAMTINELATRCGGTVQGGDPQRLITAAANLEDAGPADVAPLTDAYFANLLPKTKAGAVVLKQGEHPTAPGDTALLYAQDPEMAFIKILDLLYPAQIEEPGIDNSALIEEGVILEAEVYVGPFAIVRSGTTIGAGSWIHGGTYVGRGCTIGKHCRIHANTVLYDGIQLGQHVTIHAGCVIGADGFGYKFREGRHVKVPQVGTVVIEDHVEIGANTCIDRGSLGATVVGAGTKIDNQVQVGHNVKLGQHVILCGKAGLAGSSEVDTYGMIGANAGLSNRVKVGMAAKVGAMSGLLKDVPPKGEVFGVPADDRRAAWRQVVALRKLPELLTKVQKLEEQLEQLNAEKKKA